MRLLRKVSRVQRLDKLARRLRAVSLLVQLDEAVCGQRVCDCAVEVEGDGRGVGGAEVRHYGRVFFHLWRGGVVLFGQIPAVLVMPGLGHGGVELEGGEEEGKVHGSWGGGGIVVVECGEGGCEAGEGEVGPFLAG